MTPSRVTIAIALAAVLLAPIHHVRAAAPWTATVYYNDACGDCAVYVREELRPALTAAGAAITVRDYINEPSSRGDMHAIAEELGIPLELRSHLPTVVRRSDDTVAFVIGGHVPASIIRDAFAADRAPSPPYAIFQEVMLGMSGVDRDAVRYAVWERDREPIIVPLDTPLADARQALGQQQPSAARPLALRELLGLVLTSGFVDGINPCAFAVLLFFISFLYAMKRSHRAIAAVGLTYIAGVYIAYLGIGFGLLKAIELTFAPHFMAKLGAWLTIAVGAWGIMKMVLPLPSFRWVGTTKDAAKWWLARATVPTAFVGGFLVGLCTFPCSGAIYVAVTGLLAARATWWTGVAALLLYNAAFVAPLLILLAAAGNPYATARLEQWEQRSAKRMHLITAGVMIALGVVILVFFV